MSLAQAREAWRAARTAVAAGKIPKSTRPWAPGNFLEVAELWLARDQRDRRTVNEARRIINVYCKPLHAMTMADISRHDIRETLYSVSGQTMPRRVYGRLHRLFTWARSEDWVESHPMAGLAKPGQDIRRERVLTDDELVTVWQACDVMGWPYGPAIKLLILTAARRSEIGNLRWVEIDDYGISLKAERTKTDVARDVPLSSFARQIITEQPQIMDAADLVFPSARNTQLSAWSGAKRDLDKIANIVEPWRLHDIRRTVATGLQRLGVPLQVTEEILGHPAGSRAGVVGIYQRHSYRDEKKEALERWAEFVRNLISRMTTDRFSKEITLLWSPCCRSERGGRPRNQFSGAAALPDVPRPHIMRSATASIRGPLRAAYAGRSNFSVFIIPVLAPVSVMT